MDQDALCYRAQVLWELRPPRARLTPVETSGQGVRGQDPYRSARAQRGYLVGCVRGVQRPLLPPTRYFSSLGSLGLAATCDFSRPHWVSTGGVQGGGEVRKNGARLWGWTPHYTWFPTSADRIHTLAHPGTDTPSASAAGGKQGGGRRDKKAEPGAKVNLALRHRGLGRKGLLGLFNADGFPGNDPGWSGWTLLRETELSRNWGCACRRRGCPGGLLPLDAEPLWGASPKWTGGGRGRTRVRSRASLGMAGVEL